MERLDQRIQDKINLNKKIKVLETISLKRKTANYTISFIVLTSLCGGIWVLI